MSYWVTLIDDDTVCHSSEKIAEGGTYILGGSTECSLNVTYNYSKIYFSAEFRLKDLEGMPAETSIPILDSLVKHFGTDTDPDYWKPTPGNAGRALSILLGWAREFPHAVWSVS